MISLADRAHQEEHFAKGTQAQILQNVDQSGCRKSKISHTHELFYQLWGLVAWRVHMIYLPYLAHGNTRISALRNTAKWVKIEAKLVNLATSGCHFGQQSKAGHYASKHSRFSIGSFDQIRSSLFVLMHALFIWYQKTRLFLPTTHVNT